MVSVISCMVLAGLSVGSQDTSLSDLYQAFTHPELGRSVPLSQVTIERGNLQIVLQQGGIAPVLVGGKEVGFFFVGSGTFSMQTKDPVEAAVTRFNTKKGSDLALSEKDGVLEIGGDFDELYFQGKFEQMPPPSDFGTPDLAAKFPEHLEFFAGDLNGPAGHLWVKQQLDFPEQTVTRAQFRGGKEDAVYLYDPVDQMSETLYCLKKIPGQIPAEMKSQRYPIVISDQPLMHSRKEFLNPLYLLTDITYTLVASDGNDASLDITETILPAGRAQRTFRFNLHNTKYDDFKARQFNVKSVQTEDGRTLQFHHQLGQLLVDLGTAVQADKPFKLRFKIDGDFLIRPNGDNFWQLGVEPWFPQPDLAGQYMTVHSTVKVEQPFVPFAPGKTLSRTLEGNYNVVVNEVNKPVQFVVVHAGKYYYEELVREGLTIRVASYGIKKKSASEQLARLAQSIIDFYEPWLGPFPFDELNVLEINALGFGQAPPGTMFITREAFEPKSDTLSQIFSQGANHRYAHEIAHQYWGHVIKMGSYEEQWLTESFAEYSSSLFVRLLKGEGGYHRMVKTWRNNAKHALDVASIPTANRIRSSDFGANRMDRTHLIYDKGAFVLYALHQELGDDMFLSFLRSYQGVFAWKYGTTQDAVRLLQHLTKKDYSDFFERYYWGTELPEVDIK